MVSVSRKFMCSTGIPRRIFQTWKTQDLPALGKVSSVNLRLLHPGWDYVLFDDSRIRSFVSEEFPEYFAVFESFPFTIQRFDFVRYLIIYHFGGFYFDLDVLLWRGLSGLLGTDAVFPFEELTFSRWLRRRGMDWEIGNYGFGAAPANPFLKAVIDNCVRSQKDRAWLEETLVDVPRLFRRDFEIYNSTGPGLVSRTLAENRGLANSVHVLFPDDVCDPSNWHRFGDFGVHLMAGTWRGKHGLVRRVLARLWEKHNRRRCLVESRRLGPKRSVGEAAESIAKE